MDLGPVAGQTAHEDDGGLALADAAEEQLPAGHLEEARVGACRRQGFNGRLVDRDGFDAMRWLGFDLEEQRCLLSTTGPDDRNGGFGPGGEGEPFEVDAAAFGHGLFEECNHGFRGQDVAEELGTEVLGDLVDGRWLPVRREVVEGPAQLFADGRVGDRCLGVGDRRARRVVAVGAVAVVAACRQCDGDSEGDEGCGQQAAPSGRGCVHRRVAFHVMSRSMRHLVPAATRAPA